MVRTPPRPPTTSPSTATRKVSRSTFAHPEGQKIVRDLAMKCDVVLENYKVGGLRKYGLDYESLAKTQPAPDLLLDHRLRPERPVGRPPLATISSSRASAD